MDGCPSKGLWGDTNSLTKMDKPTLTITNY